MKLSINPTGSTDQTTNDAMIRALQLLVYALVATHPKPKAVSDLYHGLFDEQLDQLSTVSPSKPLELEALHAADHLVTAVLDDVVAGVPIV